MAAHSAICGNVALTAQLAPYGAMRHLSVVPVDDPAHGVGPLRQVLGPVRDGADVLQDELAGGPVPPAGALRP